MRGGGGSIRKGKNAVEVMLTSAKEATREQALAVSGEGKETAISCSLLSAGVQDPLDVVLDVLHLVDSGDNAHSVDLPASRTVITSHHALLPLSGNPIPPTYTRPAILAHAPSLSSSSSSIDSTSNGSNHSVSGQSPLNSSSNLPYGSSNVPATPQQRIVHVLVNRLKNKLPSHAGTSLADLEDDEAIQQTIETLVDLSKDSLDIIAWAVAELLDKLAKSSDGNGFASIDVLQSQLFCLKVLSVAMASRLSPSGSDDTRPNSRSGKGSTDPASAASIHSSSSRRRPTPSERTGQTTLSGSNLPALDDNCARYVLSVMIVFLRQTAPPHRRLMSSANLNFNASYHDFESVDATEASVSFDSFGGQSALPKPAAQVRRRFSFKHSNSSLRSADTPSVISSSAEALRSLEYEKTSAIVSNSMISLSSLIAKVAGNIVYNLSASNWPVVFSRIKNRIYFLASTHDDDPDIIDLQLLTHCSLDRARLLQSLQELSSLLVNMRREAQAALSSPLRNAVWSWIENNPEEFNECMHSHRKLEGAPERVFDLLYELADTADKPAVWPALTALMCISPDRVKNEYNQSNSHAHAHGLARLTASRKERYFAAEIVKTMTTQPKLLEVAMICALDICRAASRVDPSSEREVPLISLATDIAHEVKSVLLQWGSAQKPFWDYQDEIDVALIGDALVTIFRFLPTSEAVPVFVKCMEPEMSDAVKICAVKACITLLTEASRLPWQHPLDEIKAVLATRVHAVLSHAVLRRSEIDAQGSIKKPAFRPKAKRYTSETMPDRELLSLAALALFRADYSWYLAVLNPKESHIWIPYCLELYQVPGDFVVKMSLNRTFGHGIDYIASYPMDHPKFLLYSGWMGLTTSAVLAAVCNNLIYCRTDLKAQRMHINMALEMMYRMTRTLPTHMDHVRVEREKIPSLAIAEIAFLVSVTSADRNVSAMACTGLRLIALAERQRPSPSYAALDDEERVQRFPAYEQLGGDQKGALLGRVAHQKRIRKLMRQIKLPSPVHMAVWQECYWRWIALNEMAIRMSFDGSEDLSHVPVGDKSLSMEERHAQWQNLTLFMAAFGAVGSKDSHDSSSLAALIPSEYLPDQMRVLRDPQDLLTIFLTEIVNLLVSESVQARDVAREALGAELSPRLYTRILKELETVLHQVSEGETIDWSSLQTFLEQALSIVTTIASNMSSVDDFNLSSMLQTLVSLIVKDSDDPTPIYRLKLKFCALCDTVFDPAMTVVSQEECIARQNIVDHMVEWVQKPESENGDEYLRIVRELNLATLKTVVRLLDRLQLRSAENTSAEDANHVVSRMFIRYSLFLTNVWDYMREDGHVPDDQVSEVSGNTMAQHRDPEHRELIIQGLTSLVTANTEFGVKHCLPKAFGVDPLKQVLYAHVFARVLGKGIKLNPKEDTTNSNKQSKLCEIVKGQDTALVLAICEVCPASEVNQIISVLLNVFDTRSSLMNLMKAMVDKEISRAESDNSLFRGNSTYTRFLSAFAKLYGYNYLRSLIDPLLKSMTSAPEGKSYEIDPSRASEQDIMQNQKAVEFVAGTFLEIITSSVPAFPSMFRELCAYIVKVVNEVWPHSKFAALGAFIFLRFISPAIVSPSDIDLEMPDDPAIRRGLMTIAKIIQNLANNVFFGKEAYMTPLNDFLQENIVNVTRFLTEINKYTPPGPDEEQDEWLDTAYDDTDNLLLHRFFDKHADKIGKELLSASKITDPLASDGDAKTSWQAICEAIVENNTETAAPQLATLGSREHQPYLDIMAKCGHRDTSSVHHLFVEATVFKHPSAVFVLSVSKIDVEVLDIELLQCYIFKVLTSSAMENRTFEIIFDWTNFTPMSHVPTLWVKRTHEMIPVDVRERFVKARFLTPNDLALKYMRRLSCLASGERFAKSYSTHLSVRDLLKDFGTKSVSLPSLDYALHQEEEQRDEFYEVTMRQNHPMRVPVTLEVATSHLRITTMKPSSTLSCRATEIIPLNDVSDVYNVSTGHDPHEFIIRKIRQSSTLYFTSPMRDTIVKAIRAAKGSARNTRSPVAERFSKLSNVVATLLHIGMLHISGEDEELRAAGFELLVATCTYLDFEGRPVVPSRAIFLPGHPAQFVTQLSEKLAAFSPELTLDLINESCTSLLQNSKATLTQKINLLQYISPWIKNMDKFAEPGHKFYEHSGTKFRDCVRMLIEISYPPPDGSIVKLDNIYPMVQKSVWSEVGKLDSNVVNIVLDELMRAAVDGGIASKKGDVIADIMSGITSINVRGRIFARIRKVLGKTQSRPTKDLADNFHWTEIACLIRMCLVANSQPRNLTNAQLYVPELVHMVCLTAATGDLLVRTSVYGVVMNLLQSVHYARRGETESSPEIRALIDECALPDKLKCFGLVRTSPTSEYCVYEFSNDRAYLDALEELCHLLARIMKAVAGNQGLLNVWRARWMSLVTSSAFQLSPAIQVRAFVSLGILATSDVDDDLLYQILVAYKTALLRASDTETLTVVSMLRCICRVVPALPPQSRYLPQLFWLGVALLQVGLMSPYIEAIQLLKTTVGRMAEQGLFRDRGVAATLLDGRLAMEDCIDQVDDALGLSFDASFSFALAAVVFKGIRHAKLRSHAADALRTMLRVTVHSCGEPDHADGPGAPICQETLGYFLALISLSTSSTTFKKLLQDADVHESWYSEDVLPADLDEDAAVKIPHGLIGAEDANDALLVVAFIVAMLYSAQGDDKETEMLYDILAQIATTHPDTISLMFDAISDKVKDAFSNASRAEVLSYVSSIFRIAMRDRSKISSSMSAGYRTASASSLSTVDEGNGVPQPEQPYEKRLAEFRMHGLVKNFTFVSGANAQKTINWISELVVKIIE
ncbi:Ras GTPase activating protein ira2 [Steccherinum ochraceum]|uniref:Ras GTPase activating protein ira2 n=1 Tax=Steccherinum ochraceum TaxID=92696 RepID=A0A4R0RGC4_9APHY|nr:Ras GTPase activating protein ira2 [Steccherinum ochraceum]